MPDPQICWINQQGHIYQQHFPGHVYRLDRPLRTRTYQNSLFWLFIDYCSWRTGWLWHFCRGLSPIRLFWLTMSQHPLHFSDYHLIWINIRGGGCFSLLHGGPVTKDLQANIFFPNYASSPRCFSGYTTNCRAQGLIYVSVQDEMMDRWIIKVILFRVWWADTTTQHHAAQTNKLSVLSVLQVVLTQNVKQGFWAWNLILIGVCWMF